MNISKNKAGYWDGKWANDTTGHSNATTYAYKLLRREDFTGKSVLEVGCGSMKNHHRWETRNSRFYVGLDISDVALSDASSIKGSDVSLVRADAVRLPFKDGSFDVVMAFEALTYTGIDFFEIIREMARVSKKTLMFDVTHVNYFSPAPKQERVRNGTLIGQDDFVDAIAFTKNDIKGIIEEIGFKMKRLVTATIDEYTTYGSLLYHHYKTLGGSILKDIFVVTVKRE